MKNVQSRLKNPVIAMLSVFALAVLLFVMAGNACCASAFAGSRWNFTPTGEIFFPLILNRPSLSNVGHLLISEVLYDPSEAQGNIEWIEILNPTGEVIALGQYKIGDEETIGNNEGMLQFPAGAMIGVGQTVVIAKDAVVFKASYGFNPDFEFANSGSPVPDMVKYAAWAGGSITLTNSGDEVILLDVFDDVVDAVSWGSSNWAFNPDLAVVDKGHSIERVPGYADTDTASDWVDQPDPDPGAADITPPPPTPTVGPSPTPFSGGLLISEVLYDPTASEPGTEWIELHNSTEMVLAIEGFKIGDEETFEGSEGMYIFPTGAVVPAGGVVVIANDGLQFESEYGLVPDFELAGTHPDVPDLQKYFAWSSGGVSLSNAGDEVLLLDLFDNLVDAVSWGSSTWAFSPSVDDVIAGHSIERFPAWVDTDTAEDWRDQAEPTPGD